MSVLSLLNIPFVGGVMLIALQFGRRAALITGAVLVILGLILAVGLHI